MPVEQPLCAGSSVTCALVFACVRLLVRCAKPLPIDGGGRVTVIPKLICLSLK